MCNNNNKSTKNNENNETIQTLNDTVVLYQGSIKEYPDYKAQGEDFETLPVVVKNIVENTSSTGIYVENFIKHEGDDEDDDGPDLLSAREERDAYYSYLRSNMKMISPTPAESEQNPNCTRIWKK